jgi:hypothetical protein
MERKERRSRKVQRGGEFFIVYDGPIDCMANVDNEYLHK